MTSSIANSIHDSLKVALFARRIPFNVYTFADGSVVVISTIRGKRLSINMAHSIRQASKDEFVVSEYGKTYTAKTASSAVAKIVSMIRSNEMVFAKYTKK